MNQRLQLPLLIWAIFFCFGTLNAHAVWRVEAFTPPDQLPFEDVRDIVQSNDGAIWFSSYGRGVARLQGVDWKIYNTDHGLPSNFTRGMALDHNGDGVWVGTASGLAHIQADHVRTFGPDTIPLMEDPKIINVDRIGSDQIWFGTENGAIYAFQEISGEEIGGWKTIQPVGTTTSVWGFLEDSSGTVWVALGQTGILKIQDGTHHFISIQEIPSFRVKSFIEDHEGKIWAAGSYIPSVWDGSTWTPGDEPSDTVALGISPEGVIFAGTSHGLKVREADSWEDLKLDSHLGIPLIRIIEFTQNSQAWIGTKEGILRLRQTRWHDVSHSETSAHYGQAFHASPAHQPLSINRRNELVEFRGDQWHSLLKLPGHPHNYQDLTAPRDEKTWVLNGNSIYLVDLGTSRILKTLTTPDHGFAPRKLLETLDGRLFVYGIGGIYYWDNERWQPFATIPQGYSVPSLNELTDGSILVCHGPEFGTDIEIWQGSRKEVLLDQDDYNPQYFLATCMVSNDGRIWAGTLGMGALVFKGSSVEHILTPQGLQSAHIVSIYETREGTIWFGTQNRGVASYANGRWITYSHEEGLPSHIAVELGEHPDGDIWLATRNYGLYRYHPDPSPPNTEISAGPSEIPSHGIGVFSFKGYDAWGDTSEERLEYSWRLYPRGATAASSSWSPFEATHTMLSPQLNPGHYVLEVRAADLDRNIDPSPAIWTFAVIPPFWRQPGFFVPLILLLILAVVLALFLNRKHRALRMSEASYRTIFDSVGDAIIIHDTDSYQIIDVNRKWCEVFEHSREWMLGRHPADFSDGDHATMLRRANDYLDMAMSGKVVLFEWPLKTGAGEVIHSEVSLRRSRVNNRDIVIASVRDISSRKRAEKELRESESRFRKLSNAAQEGIVFHDHGLIVDANIAFAKMFGYELSEMIGMHIRDLLNADAYALAEKQVRENTENTIEGLARRRDSSTFHCRITGRPFDYRGLALRVATVNDITDLKETEEALRQSEENLAITLDSIGDAVIATDADGHIARLNPSAELLIGRPQDEVRGCELTQIIQTDSDDFPIAALFSDILTKGELIVLNQPVTLLDSLGETHQIACSGAPIRDRSGAIVGVVAIFRNVSEQLRLEEQLRQAQKMESLGQLAGGVAHDFNNLLGGIMGYADLLAMSLKHLDNGRQYSSYAEAIQEAAQRASDLTTQLLAFSRRQQLRHDEVDVHEVIDKVVKLLQHTIDRRIEIHKSLKASPAQILGDPSQIQNAILNLAVNARDAMPNGGQLRLSTANLDLNQALIDAQNLPLSPGEYLEVCVNDTGVGMDPGTIRHIFEPFFTTKSVGKGTGLGLAAVYGIVESHKGTIQVQSKPGHGSIFKLLLPLSRSGKAKQAVVEELIVHGQGTILMVDDEAMIRNMAHQILKHLGYQVMMAENGIEAVEIYKQHYAEIDLIILDLVMPKMNGRETLDALRRINPNARVIIASGFSLGMEFSDKDRQMVQGFLQKPFQMGEFSRLIAETLN